MPGFCAGPGPSGGHSSGTLALEALQARPGDQRKHLALIGARWLSVPKKLGLSTLPHLVGMSGPGAAVRGPSTPVASFLQPPEDDAAIVGAVRLLSVLMAALTMDLAGRKVLLFISGERQLVSCACSFTPQPSAAATLVVGAVWLGARKELVHTALLALPPQRLAHTGCSRKAYSACVNKNQDAPCVRCDGSPNMRGSELAAPWEMHGHKPEPHRHRVLREGPPWRTLRGSGWLRGSWPPRATCLSTAAIMFAANLTLGLYIHFSPKPLTPNSTVGLESVLLGDPGQPLATPTSYLTLVPLLATMLFIMGRHGSDSMGAVGKGWVGCRPGTEGPPVCKVWGCGCPGWHAAVAVWLGGWAGPQQLSRGG